MEMMEIGSLNPAIVQRPLDKKWPFSVGQKTAAVRSPGTGRKKEAFEEGVLPGSLAAEFSEQFQQHKGPKGVRITVSKTPFGSEMPYGYMLRGPVRTERQNEGQIQKGC